MKKMIVILGLIFSQAALGVDCNVHRIYCSIVKLNPDVDKAQAMEASNVLYKATKHYDLDPMASVAVIQQESGWEFDVAMVVHKNGAVDLGLTQININTAADYGLSIPKLTADNTYAIWAHAKIMRRKINICKAKGWARAEEYSCYNSFTPVHRIRYARKVQKHLARLQGRV